jgi:hypothetical protein
MSAMLIIDQKVSNFNALIISFDYLNFDITTTSLKFSIHIQQEFKLKMNACQNGVYDDCC